MPWTPEQTARHRQLYGWRYGANYIPADAINQLAMWQAETFTPARIENELSWAARLGMKLVRVYLHDLLHQQDADGFWARMDRFLSIANRHRISAFFVFFDDCWLEDSALGPQPAPRPYTHNSGWVQSPGPRAAKNQRQWPRLERYVTGTVRHFADDPRIYGWDVYNEPGNGVTGEPGGDRPLRGAESLPLLREAFAWAKAGGPSQPLTSGLWRRDAAFEALNACALENSDLVSYHCYAPEPEFSDMLAWVQGLADGRRILCSEYLCRPGNSIIQMLPLFKAASVDATHWGLVNGLTQTHLPWGWSPDKGEPAVWHHDVLLPDGSAKYPEEEAFYRTLL